MTKFGLFKCLVMFFGLCNSPATFQTMMNIIFHDLIVAQVLAVYMDDILVFTKTIKEYRFIISADNISMDPVKVDGIATWPTPKYLKEVQSFLGFGNFYRRFIKDFATTARPLNDLGKKDIPFEWTQKRNDAFENLKHCFTSTPVLIYPEELLAVIHADTLEVALSAEHNTKTTSNAGGAGASI
ncbi:hypothetical protein HETIRDRAFT_430068 [Heterobasidion irregulare TC 32-1]|uniref:Reverse transcriptase domain-containing protein n=1 Tax=Heterobasidion irregulare (strain TC 32-1) TaxID=747525 RepID=W4JUH9_HETIT|nr:uncharacterized protein HETIRDRAFT_430068 [Heterobasidion irregulare TC 32-1]ETW76735.1 hypothetical protein HETIRDRAFT_430068 [Heterobasidion irregulare TC 32-1]